MCIASYPAAASRPTARVGSRAVPSSSCPSACFSRLFRRLDKLAQAHAAGKLAFFNDLARLADHDTFTRHLAAHAPPRVGGLRQAPVRRTRSGAGLPGPLHSSRRHQQQPPDRSRRQRRHVPMERLSRPTQVLGDSCIRTMTLAATSSCGASFSTSCPTASIASATMGSSPAAGAPPTSIESAN